MHLHLISEHVTVWRVAAVSWAQVRSVWTPLHCLWRTCFGCGAKGRKPRSRESRLVSQPASLRPGSNLLANICAAEIHPFNFSSFWTLSLSSFFTHAASTWTDFHGCSFCSGTIICTVLCGLMWNDWGGQVYLSFAVRFTFFLSSLLSVCLLLHSWLPSLFFLLSER